MSKIKPALTAEEWSKERKSFENRTTGERGMIEFSTIELLEYTNEDGVHNGLHIYGNGLFCNVNAPNLFALSALCLHDQPFGFTRDMLRALRELGHPSQTIEEMDLAWAAMDRIEALLPPEGD